jgi:hypothetical protein
MENMMAQGIRLYGPGKFRTILDSYAYDLVGDGVIDEETSYPEGGGWYGLIRIDEGVRDVIAERAEKDEEDLTEWELDWLKSHKAIIFFERSDGIVEADWYKSLKTAETAWGEIEEQVGAAYEDEDETSDNDEEDDDDGED